jgi:hypothetical protein
MDVGAPTLGLGWDDFKPINPAICETRSAPSGVSADIRDDHDVRAPGQALGFSFALSSVTGEKNLPVPSFIFHMSILAQTNDVP